MQKMENPDKNPPKKLPLSLIDKMDSLDLNTSNSRLRSSQKRRDRSNHRYKNYYPGQRYRSRLKIKPILPNSGELSINTDDEDSSGTDTYEYPQGHVSEINNKMNSLTSGFSLMRIKNENVGKKRISRSVSPISIRTVLDLIKSIDINDKVSESTMAKFSNFPRNLRGRSMIPSILRKRHKPYRSSLYRSKTRANESISIRPASLALKGVNYPSTNSSPNESD